MKKLKTEEQLFVLQGLLPHPPGWFVCCGLGDGNECDLAAWLWPQCRLVGLDPDPRAYHLHLGRPWARYGRVTNAAAGDGEYTGTMLVNSLGAASLAPFMLAECPADARKEVTVTKLDRVEVAHGPWSDAVLWLDCEGMDYQALSGAGGLLQANKVLAIVKETWTQRPEAYEDNRACERYLTGHGFRMVETFGVEWWGHNEVWLSERCLKLLHGWGDY